MTSMRRDSLLFRTGLPLLFGLGFGAGLVVSGMVNPQKVVSFLDLRGAWDPSLLFVLVGAILASAPFMHLAEKRGHALDATPVQFPARTGIDKKLLFGSLLFGVGWGLSGLCPGAVLAGLGLFHSALWSFTASMLVGMWIFGLVQRSRSRASSKQ